MPLRGHTVLPLRTSGLCQDTSTLTLVESVGGEHAVRGQEALLDAVAKLHTVDDLPALRVAAVEAAERLCRGSAAALFTVCQDSSMLALLAAGPGWRSAERDAPAWLAPLSGPLADLVRAEAQGPGRLVRGRSTDGPDVALHACGSGPDARWALLVAWPTGLAARPADLAAIDRLAAHLDIAVRRLEALTGWRDTAQTMRAAQSELVRAHAERAATSLARGTAHELNNSLSVLLGVSECLLMAGGLDAQGRADVEAIHDAACKTARLAQRLSFVARSVRDGDPGPVDLGELLAAAIERLRTEEPSLQVAVETGASVASGPCVVWAHPADLAEVAGALVRLHVESSGGPVTLEANRSDICLVTEAPASTPADDADPWALCYSRRTRWRGPVLAACRRIALGHGWRLLLEAGDGPRQRVVLALPAAGQFAAADLLS